MQTEIYYQNSQFFYPSELFTLDHTFMRHPVAKAHAAHPLTTSLVSIYGFPNFDDFDEKLMPATTLKVA